jgi:hypothetical protein
MKLFPAEPVSLLPHYPIIISMAEPAMCVSIREVGG